MVSSCCIVGCTNRYKAGSGISFFRFPTKPTHRRAAWISAVNRSAGKGSLEFWQPSEHDRVCGTHFGSGRPQIDPLKPDYIPNLNLGYTKKTKFRVQKRNKRRKGKDTLRQKQEDNKNDIEAASALLDLSTFEKTTKEKGYSFTVIKMASDDSGYQVTGKLCPPRLPMYSASKESTEGFTTPYEQLLMEKAIEELKLKEEILHRSICALSSPANLVLSSDIPAHTSTVNLPFYFCNFCKEQSDCKSAILKHVVTQHSFSCSLCDFTAFTRSCLIQHQLLKHIDAEEMKPILASKLLLLNVTHLQRSSEHMHQSAERVHKEKEKQPQKLSDSDSSLISSLTDSEHVSVLWSNLWRYDEKRNSFETSVFKQNSKDSESVSLVSSSGPTSCDASSKILPGNKPTGLEKAKKGKIQMNDRGSQSKEVLCVRKENSHLLHFLDDAEQAVTSSSVTVSDEHSGLRAVNAVDYQPDNSIIDGNRPYSTQNDLQNFSSELQEQTEACFSTEFLLQQTFAGGSKDGNDSVQTDGISVKCLVSDPNGYNQTETVTLSESPQRPGDSSLEEGGRSGSPYFSSLSGERLQRQLVEAVSNSPGFCFMDQNTRKVAFDDRYVNDSEQINCIVEQNKVQQHVFHSKNVDPQSCPSRDILMPDFNNSTKSTEVTDESAEHLDNFLTIPDGPSPVHAHIEKKADYEFVLDENNSQIALQNNIGGSEKVGKYTLLRNLLKGSSGGSCSLIQSQKSSTSKGNFVSLVQRSSNMSLEDLLTQGFSQHTSSNSGFQKEDQNPSDHPIVLVCGHCNFETMDKSVFQAHVKDCRTQLMNYEDAAHSDVNFTTKRNRSLISGRNEQMEQFHVEEVCKEFTKPSVSSSNLSILERSHTHDAPKQLLDLFKDIGTQGKTNILHGNNQFLSGPGQESRDSFQPDHVSSELPRVSNMEKNQSLGDTLPIKMISVVSSQELKVKNSGDCNKEEDTGGDETGKAYFQEISPRSERRSPLLNLKRCADNSSTEYKEMDTLEEAYGPSDQHKRIKKTHNFQPPTPPLTSQNKFYRDQVRETVHFSNGSDIKHLQCLSCQFSMSSKADMRQHLLNNHLHAPPYAKLLRQSKNSSLIYFCRGHRQECTFYSTEAPEISQHIPLCYLNCLDGFVENEEIRDFSPVLIALGIALKKNEAPSILFRCLRCDFSRNTCDPLVRHVINEHPDEVSGVLLVQQKDGELRIGMVCVTCSTAVPVLKWSSHPCRVQKRVEASAKADVSIPTSVSRILDKFEEEALVREALLDPDLSFQDPLCELSSQADCEEKTEPLWLVRSSGENSGDMAQPSVKQVDVKQENPEVGGDSDSTDREKFSFPLSSNVSDGQLGESFFDLKTEVEEKYSAFGEMIGAEMQSDEASLMSESHISHSSQPDSVLVEPFLNLNTEPHQVSHQPTGATTPLSYLNDRNEETQILLPASAKGKATGEEDKIGRVADNAQHTSAGSGVLKMLLTSPVMLSSNDEKEDNADMSGLTLLKQLLRKARMEKEEKQLLKNNKDIDLTSSFQNAANLPVKTANQPVVSQLTGETSIFPSLLSAVDNMEPQDPNVIVIKDEEEHEEGQNYRVRTVENSSQLSETLCLSHDSPSQHNFSLDSDVYSNIEEPQCPPSSQLSITIPAASSCSVPSEHSPLPMIPRPPTLPNMPPISPPAEGSQGHVGVNDSVPFTNLLRGLLTQRGRRL